ncbi:MAG: hypothetical protein KFF73_00200 [Cyclobacteriaceae bacterium]|nr:hypothetical protein [Cyclobacteriaceae bacterium]
MSGKKLQGTLVLLFLSYFSFAQLPAEIFDKVEIWIDTKKFDSNQNLVQYNGENHLYFEFEENDPVCEVRIIPKNMAIVPDLSLIRSSDFDVLDSMINVNDQYLRFRIKFRDLSNSSFLKFAFQLNSEDAMDPAIHLVPILPVTETTVEFFPEDTDLFVGEEKQYPLITDNLRNIRVDNIWTRNEAINYRLTEEDGKLTLHLSSQRLGWQTLTLAIRTRKPYINEMGDPSFDLPLIVREFNVKSSRLRFLRIDHEELILDHQNLAGYEIQLEDNSYFTVGKTYRIEAQEEPGGALIGEIFTRSYLNNGRILCWFRPYAYHRKSEGYLYIKDDDISRFITNVDIIPNTAIESIQILREGSDWTNNLNVFPGETIEVRIRGESLHRARLTFEDVYDISPDTLVRNEKINNYTLKIPVNILNRQITIYNNGKSTGFSLIVKEYQRAREFDFISLEGNGFKRKLSDLSNTILVDNTIQDVIIGFDRDLIDSDGRLFGIQYLNLKITIRGNNNELIELQEINDLVICPGEYSPRSSFYRGNCSAEFISLNNHLSKKTFELDEWSKIILEFSHDKNKYDGAGYSKRVEIILQRFWRFDIDVSFPAGLITFGGENSGNLTGISMAMIAQFSFYEKNKINRFQPYKVGVGFIALDAFNFSDNDDNRDIAMVVLGSLYPTRRDAKLTFPLYFGMGYKLKNEEFFFLVGPGIRVRL